MGRGSHRNRFTGVANGRDAYTLPMFEARVEFPDETHCPSLLVALSVAWSIPAKAQSPGVAEYASQSMVAGKKQQKTYRKAAKKQQKAMKKYEKAQRKAAKKEAKKTNRPA